ncbi:uncharacterized protein LOC114311884 [Camellia sinensis]|uniref:uncharacterized protein LOC114311884 n=1 Tax=Camellia sinensis TaxID=4442 RepID=UPI00103659EB|nr:uncharacterized protein LOC114311884 [Camellia sinensis]
MYFQVEELPDSVKWTASPSGNFTVASMRKWYEETQGPKLQVPNLLWRGVAPPKAQFLSWLAWRGRVKTISLLQRCRALSRDVENLCLFCKLEPESVDHLFLQCTEIWKVWSSLLQWWGVSWVIPATVDGVLLWWMGTKFKKSVERIWRLVPIAMLWSVWRLRNECVFKGSQPNMEALGEIVKVRVGLWAKSGLPSQSVSAGVCNQFVGRLQLLVCQGSTEACLAMVCEGSASPSGIVGLQCGDVFRIQNLHSVDVLNLCLLVCVTSLLGLFPEPGGYVCSLAAEWEVPASGLSRQYRGLLGYGL